MQIQENKKLIISLLFSFVVIASFTGIIGYISTNISKDSINQLVGQQSTTVAYTVLNKIDVSIANKISELNKIGRESVIQNALVFANKLESISENKIVSNKLQEKISIDSQEFGYKIYKNLTLLNIDGNVISSSGNIENNFFQDVSLDELVESRIILSDVYYEPFFDDEVYHVGILVTDTKGKSLGSLHALVSFEEIIMIIEESKDQSQFTSSEFDLFDDDELLLYSTADRSEEDFTISDLVLGFDDLHYEIEDELEELDEQYDEIIREYGYIEPELSEEQWEEIEERFFPLDQRYEDLLEEYDFGNLSDNELEALEEMILDLDLEYDEILREYGFIVPQLSDRDQLEFDEKIIELESRYEEIYRQYDLDFTFGEKGFSIVESDEENEILHSYSRQRGYLDFEGFDWILVVHTEMDEILRDVNNQRDFLLLLTIAMTGLATVLGIFFARIFYKQSQKINESEKMSTIGHLSSNIAHDLRNPLGTIRSSAERIYDQNKNQNTAISDEVKRINRSVKRMSHQVEGVLNYVRTTPLITDEFSILEMLNYAKNSLEVPENIKIILPKNDLIIECDQEKIEITFVNLILNAIQAIGKKENGLVEIKINEGVKYIRISFENNGPIIPDDEISNLFTPLFTTHLKGTGLGLSSCKNIIEQHNGKITVRQDPVTFTIHIPKKQ